MQQTYLADTQTVIWSIISPSKITPEVRTILLENPVLVSEISLLEIAIKQKIGRLPEFSLSIDELTTQLINDGFQLLSIERKHITTYNQVPLFDNHRDPFDRLLIATALSEGTSIISADKNFRLYTETIRLVEA